MNKTVNSHPLTQNDLKRINDALTALQQAEQIVAKAKAAGLQLTEQEDLCFQCRSTLEGIKQQFFGLTVGKP